MEYLNKQAELERLEEDLVADKQLVVELMRRRQENREALGSFSKGQMEADKRVWFFAGGLFMKMPKAAAKGLLDSDQQQLDSEIDRLYESIKERTAHIERRKKGRA